MVCLFYMSVIYSYLDMQVHSVCYDCFQIYFPNYETIENHFCLCWLRTQQHFVRYALYYLLRFTFMFLGVSFANYKKSPFLDNLSMKDGILNGLTFSCAVKLHNRLSFRFVSRTWSIPFP